MEQFGSNQQTLATVVGSCRMRIPTAKLAGDLTQACIMVLPAIYFGLALPYFWAHVGDPRALPSSMGLETLLSFH